jgi:diguanylate cyclase (GGDEF)-like protein
MRTKRRAGGRRFETDFARGRSILKVLVVDDTPEFRHLLSTMIESLGHTVVLASDGQQAVEVAREEQPDLVLMDIQMPNKNGYDAAREIVREQGDDWLPIIFLSASESDQDLEKAIDSGGSDYLLKPVSLVVLGAKINSMRRIDAMRRKLVELTHQLGAAYRELEAVSQRDALTGASNRGHFDRYLADELRRAHRAKAPLSVVLVDVDFFKLYNDHYGHQSGDDCLRKIVEALRSACRRPADLVARYGGEEFALVLPETPLEGAERVAEAARKAVQGRAIPHARSGGSDCVTISAGVATAAPQQGLTAERLIANADEALYSAKSLGRNRVVKA